jgi:hypothetical protein
MMANSIKKSPFRPQKMTLGIFALMLSIVQFGSFFGGFLLAWHAYPIIYTIQEALRINPSHIGTPVYDYFSYGIALPINAAFMYLISCWVVFVFQNIGGKQHHRLAVVMLILLILYYMAPFTIVPLFW